MAIRLRGLKRFERQLNKFGKKQVPEEAAQFLRATAFDLLRRIVFRTPVDTGRARGNWQTVIGSSNDSVDPSGEPLRNAAVILRDTPPYSVITLFNNVEYIKFLEEGSSKQAPRGMVQVSIAEAAKRKPLFEQLNP